MKGQHPGIVCCGFVNYRKLGQQAHGLLDLVEKIVRRSESAFADVPFDSGIGIRFGLCG